MASGAPTNFLMAPQPDGTALRVDFWYIDNKTRMFMPITPTLYPKHQLPGLVEYPWHLVNEERFSSEMRALEDDGLLITLVLWDADNQPPLEICFLTARMGSDKLLIVITPHDYPQRRAERAHRAVRADAAAATICTKFSPMPGRNRKRSISARMDA